MSEDIPTPSPDEIDRRLQEDQEEESENSDTTTSSDNPDATAKTPSPYEFSGETSVPIIPNSDQTIPGDLPWKISLFGLLVGFIIIGLTAWRFLDAMGFRQVFSGGIGAGIILSGAGFSGVLYSLSRRMDRQHAEIKSVAGLGLPGLDPQQAARLKRQQELIDKVLSDLPKHQDRLEALDENIPTKVEQIRRLAESQRQIWEEIEEEYQ